MELSKYISEALTFFEKVNTGGMEFNIPILINKNNKIEVANEDTGNSISFSINKPLRWDKDDK